MDKKVSTKSDEIKKEIEQHDRQLKIEKKRQKPDIRLAHMLSEIVNNERKKSRVISFSELSKLSEKEGVPINSETIIKNFNEHIDGISVPSFLTVVAVSKVLDFSLDELRDGFFNFDLPLNETSVQQVVRNVRSI